MLGRVKGGLAVDVGIKAFMPGTRPIRARSTTWIRWWAGYPGQDHQAQPPPRQRGGLAQERRGRRDQLRKTATLEHLAEGSVVTGTVKNLTEYGAFIDLGGIDGLPLGKNARDIKPVRALGNYHRVEVHVPHNQFPVNINGAQGMIEKVFTRLQTVARAANPIAGKERPLMGKHAVGHEQIGDGGSTRAGSDFQHFTAREIRTGLVEVPCHPSRGGQAHPHDHHCE